MVRFRKRSFARTTAAVLALGFLSVGSWAPRPASAASADIVISQVYGGGGSGSAIYKNDYIELFNRGTTAVSVTGWSVQYASATGSSWSKTNLTGTIQPGQYLLIAEQSGSAGAALPTPDITGTFAMSNSSGKVALVTNQTALTCGGAANNCFPNPNIRDFVGYGTANNYEGSAATGTLTATTAALRSGAGCTDTDQNGPDFAVSGPAPRNSASPANDCGSTPPPPPPASGVRIHDIQGAAHTSPLAGTSVNGIPGIVTAKKSNGFWMQDPTPDADPATSEGIFVFTSTAPTVNIGDAVTVSGTVQEYRPGSDAANLTTTQISSPAVTVTATGNPLPAPTVAGTGGRIPPSTVIEDDAAGSVESGGTFDPDADGIDFWESLEGMRIQVNDALVVGPKDSHGEIPVVGDNGASAGLVNARGGITIRSGDFNPERIILDDALAPTPAATVGDVMPSVVGVLDYSFGNYKLLPSATPTVTANGLAKEVTAAAAAGQLMVSTMNVENLAPTDPQSKFDGLAGLLVNNLKAPDIVAVQEVQDNNGATNDKVVAADQTWNKLISAITAVGGPAYQYRQIDPVDDQDGGAPGGNIRQGFLFRTDRGLAFVDRPGATSTTANSVVSTPGGPQLKYSPGRIDPRNSAWNASRKPLAAEFMWGNHHLFVINNHFNSKGGDDPLFGVAQPPVRSSETQRHSQASIVHDFVRQIVSLDTNAQVIVLGDLNDFQFSETVSIVKGADLMAPIDTLPEAERYSYTYEGNAQALDQILISNRLYTVPWEFDIVHVNSQYSPANRLSDHDPSVIRISLP